MENWIRDDVDFFKINCDKDKKISIISYKSLEEEFYSYANGFKEAAYILAEDALNSQEIAKLDINFYSIAFLYRHSIELILKAIGFQYIKEDDERKLFLKQTCHNLYEILIYISQYIKKYIELDKEAYNWVISMFEDMDDLDKESDSFRYPFRIRRNKDEIFNLEYHIEEFFDERKDINLLNFANKMEIIFDILNSYYLEGDSINKLYKEYDAIFLEEGGNYYGMSVIGDNRIIGKTFYCNIKSYRNGANILYDYINRNLEIRSRLFMPLCYLYRNSLELSMKDILFDESSYSYEEILKNLKESKHNLNKIWNLIKDDIVKHCNNVGEDDKVICNVEKYIHQIHCIDPAADKFRYPIDKDLNLYFKRNKNFDIDNVKNFFEDILIFFEGVSILMNEQNEMLREMEHEYMNY